MGKGSQPSGNTTVTQTNPVQTAQLPYLENLWGVANSIAGSQAGSPDLSNLTSYLQQAYGTTNAAGLAIMPGAMGSLSNYIGAGIPSAAATSALYGLGGGANFSPYINAVNATAGNIWPTVFPYINAGTGAAQSYGQQAGWLGNSIASDIGSYTNPMTTFGTNAAGVGNQLAGDIGSYTSPMMGYGQQAGWLANSAASDITNYTNPMTAYGDTAAGYGADVASLAPNLFNYGSNAAAMGAGQGSALNSLASVLSGWGSGLSSGALSTLGGYGSAASSVASPQIGSLMGLSGMAVSGNPIYDSLMGMASGQYVNPSTNPALAGTISAATDPITRAYMTATAPQTDSAMEAAGRYGSGALSDAQSVNERNLGTALSNTTSQIVSNAYNTGLNSMLSAGTALGGAYNAGVANAGNLATSAGTLGQQGYNIGGSLTGQGYNLAGNIGLGAYTGAGTALGNAANAYNTGYATAGNLTGAGAGLYGTAGNLATSAGNLYGAAGGLNTSALSTALSGNINAGNLFGSAGGLDTSALLGAANTYGTAGNLYGTAGGLNTNALSAALSGNINAGSLISGGYSGAASAADTALMNSLYGYGSAGNLYGSSLSVPGSLYNMGGALSNSGLLSYSGLLGQAPTFAQYPAQAATSAVNAPFLPWQDASSIFGGAVGGSSTTTQPYFTNPTANALGTGLGLVGLGNGLFGSSGLLSGLFGGGASDLWGAAAVV